MEPEICPYKSTNGRKCSHKRNGKVCIYNKEKKCELYKEWLKQERFNTELPVAVLNDNNRWGENE